MFSRHRAPFVADTVGTAVAIAARMVRPLCTTLVLLAALLAGCSDSTTPPTVQDAGDASTCVCSTDDAGVSVTSRECYCLSADSCQDYAATVATLCNDNVVHDVTVASYTGCNVKRLSYNFGASVTSSLYDATTGAFLGARYDDDTQGRCPGTSQMIGYSTATGIYEVPASCQPAGETNPCGSGDAGPDAAADGAPRDASSD